MSTSEDTIVEVEETLTGTYMQSARSDRHVLNVDKPLALGGNDAGPGPYEYLLMGLGACTTMTLRMYAERKNIPLSRVRVRLSRSKVHASDCADCETQDGRIDEVIREIEIEGDLDDQQRQRLMLIADRCPVHRTLTSETKVRSGMRGS